MTLETPEEPQDGPQEPASQPTPRFRPISGAFIIITMVVVALYDLIPAFVDEALGDTISEVMRDWSWGWWCLPFGWGVLAGHFWGPPFMPPTWAPWGLLGVGLASVAICAWGGIPVRVWWQWWPILLVGVVIGATLWPLDRTGGEYVEEVGKGDQVQRTPALPGQDDPHDSGGSGGERGRGLGSQDVRGPG